MTKWRNTFRFMSGDVICSTEHFHPQCNLWCCDQMNSLHVFIAHHILKARCLSPALLCFRELLWYASTHSRQYGESPHHLPGAPQPAQKLPHTQQIAQQPGEDCRTRREQRGRLGAVRQVSLNLYVDDSIWG